MTWSVQPLAAGGEKNQCEMFNWQKLDIISWQAQVFSFFFFFFFFSSSSSISQCVSCVLLFPAQVMVGIRIEESETYHNFFIPMTFAPLATVGAPIKAL